MTGNQLAIETVKPLLAELGFKKRTGGIFTIDVEKNVLGFLGLNSASRHLARGEVEINPCVGVRHQQIERLVAELRGAKFHSYIPATTGTPIGYLFPEPRFRQWHFTPDNAGETAKDMVNAIATYGLPYMRSITSLDDFRRALEPKRGGNNFYRLPVATLLSGDLERAKSLLDESLTAVGDRTDAAAEEFRRFADAFRRHICNVADNSQT